MASRKSNGMTSPAAIKRLCGAHWDEFASADPIGRLWRRDHTLWKPSPDEISNRLGWLDLPFSMQPLVAELDQFRILARQCGFRDCVVLGMGGSSLGAEVLRQAFPSRESGLRLFVLDSTFPATVRRVANAIDPGRALFLVSSKSGSTVEVLSLYQFFRDLVRRVGESPCGRNFVAITDKGTSLEKMAQEEGFWRTYLNPSDVGGRYSILSYFGLAPGALNGADVVELLRRAREMARRCSIESPIEENPGAWLGFAFGCLAKAGRDKLTLITSPCLAGFGLWAEQLLAESTGKEGRGIVPIAQEPLAPRDRYGDDRFFVFLRLAGDDNEQVDRHANALAAAGAPVILSNLRDVYDLGAEFFKWEFATALAGARLGVNPFDQPNVEESKRNTRRILEEWKKSGKGPSATNAGDFAKLLASAKSGDYLAVMAFADQTPELDAAFAALRMRILVNRRLPTTLGYGPRFLHSTGQLHKGGAGNGLFLQITCEPSEDMPIPGAACTFGQLALAQAAGDFEALLAAKRRVVRVHVPKGQSIEERIRALCALV